MKKILLAVLILSVFVLVGCINIPQPQAMNQNQTPQPLINQANLNQTQPETDPVYLVGTVLDKATKKIVDGAIVYIGTGDWRCYTAALGQCSIANKQLVPGDYAVAAYKKGYNRSVISLKLKPGDNLPTLEIEPTTMPQTIRLIGTILSIAEMTGTRSENTYFKIKSETGETPYIFNEIGYNTGFEKLVGKKVTVTGYKDKGFIGWQHQEAEGIYIEEMIIPQTPDLSCQKDADCKIATTDCRPCDCGQAVNINWQAYCPFTSRNIYACAPCPPYQAKCINNKCEKELIKL
jgi:hypothetical protein